MSRNTKLLTFLTAALAPCLVMAAAPASAADETFTIRNAIPLPTLGTPPTPQSLNSFDISEVDPVLGLYALGDRTNKSVDVINTHTLAISQIFKSFAGATGNNDTSGPDGVLFVNHNTIWVGDAPSRFWVIDVASPHASIIVNVP